MFPVPKFFETRNPFGLCEELLKLLKTLPEVNYGIYPKYTLHVLKPPIDIVHNSMLEYTTEGDIPELTREIVELDFVLCNQSFWAMDFSNMLKLYKLNKLMSFDEFKNSMLYGTPVQHDMNSCNALNKYEQYCQSYESRGKKPPNTAKVMKDIANEYNTTIEKMKNHWRCIESKINNINIYG